MVIFYGICQQIHQQHFKQGQIDGIHYRFLHLIVDIDFTILKKVFGIILLAIAVKLFTTNIKQLF